MILDAKQLKAKKGDILVKAKQVPDEYKERLDEFKYFEVIDISDYEVHMYAISSLGRMHFYREIPTKVKCWSEIIRKENRIKRI